MQSDTPEIIKYQFIYEFEPFMSQYNNGSVKIDFNDGASLELMVYSSIFSDITISAILDYNSSQSYAVYDARSQNVKYHLEGNITTDALKDYINYATDYVNLNSRKLFGGRKWAKNNKEFLHIAGRVMPLLVKKMENGHLEPEPF